MNLPATNPPPNPTEHTTHHYRKGTEIMNAIINDRDLERVKAEILEERAKDQAWLSDVFYSISKAEIDELGELLLSDTAEFGRKFRAHFDRMMKDLDSDAWDRLNQGIGQ